MSHHLVSRVRAALVQQPWLFLTLALAAVAVLFLPTPAAAQCVASHEMLNTAVPLFDIGSAVVHNDGTGDAVYVFDFTASGKMAKSRDLISWEYFSLGQGVVSPVSFDGRIVAGPAAKAWDGATWRPLPGLDGGGITKLAVVGSRLYAAGSFTSANAQPTAGLAWFDGTTWYPLNVTAGVAPRDITEYQGGLAIIGNITTIAGQPCQGVAFFDGTNWTVPSVGAPTNKAYCIGIGNNLYLTAGNPPGFGRLPPIVRWTGSAWQVVPPMSTTPIAEFWGPARLERFGNSLMLKGGSMDRGTNAVVVLFDGTAWTTAVSCRTVAGYASIFSAIQLNAELFVCGRFDIANGQAINCAARWDAQTIRPAYAPVTNFNPSVLVDYDGELIAGGANIARVEDKQLVPLGEGVNNSVRAMKVIDGVLYAGGDFTQAGGSAANHVAAWDGASWSSIGVGSENGVSGTITTIEGFQPYAGWVVYGGLFDTAGGVTDVGNIAAFDGTSWHSLGGGVNGMVRAMQTFNSRLVVAGLFTYARAGREPWDMGVPVSGVASYLNGTWQAMGVGANFDNFAVHNGELFAASSQNANAVAVHVWDGEAWKPDAPPTLLGAVTAIHSDGLNLFAINNFGQLWKRTGGGEWVSTPYGLDHSPGGFWGSPPAYERDMHALTSRDGKLYMGGRVLIYFTQYEWSEEIRFAQGAVTEVTLADETPVFTLQPTDETVDRLSTVTLISAVEPQVGPVAFQWYHDGLPVAGGTAATLLIEHAGAADAGEYYVVASNLCGAATSNAVTVTVTGPCTEDINGDQVVDLGDLAQLLAGYGLCAGEAGFDPASDLNQDACVNLSDLAVLLAVFGSDC